MSPPAVMSSVDECELDLLAVHAGVGLRVGDPDRGVVRGRFLARLLQQILDTLEIGRMVLFQPVLRYGSILI